MKIAIVAALIPALLFGANDEYRKALPGYRYSFPRDHFSHPDFKTEWWYYTGNIRDPAGRRYGFELTFFRQSVARLPQRKTVWDLDQAWLAHLAWSDIDGQKFQHWSRLNRTGPGLAGASAEQMRVWNGNWAVAWKGNTQELTAIVDGLTLRLRLQSAKPPVIHGERGVSQKAAGAGNASHYISFTRLAARGTAEYEGRTFLLEGSAWMDHEFFTHQLESGQTGWDWLSLQFDDNTELMVFRLRRKDGATDPFSAGTFVDARGVARRLSSADFTMSPGGRHYGPYPIEWRVSVPSLGIDVRIHTRLEAQELAAKSANAPSYWEGAMEAAGTRAGVGYLEMTGYRGTRPAL